MSLPDPPVDINAQLDRMPFGTTTGLRSHVVTAVASDITLAPGGYVAMLSGSTDAFVSIGGTAAVPVADAVEVLAAFFLPAGVPTTFSIGGAASVATSFILATVATSTVYLMRVS